MVTLRSYRLLDDYPKVFAFLQDIYEKETLNGYLLPQFFEHAHASPAFKYILSPRFGLWEEGGELAAVACFEMDLGECLTGIRKGYEFLLDDIIRYAQDNLSATSSGKRELTVWTGEKETAKKEALARAGFTCVEKRPATIFDYDKPFYDSKIPEGFSLISLEEECDIAKLHAVLRKSFKREDDASYDQIYNEDGRVLMLSGPTFSKQLSTVIKAPDGEYACFAGMRADSKNHYAYLEPLCTAPEYQRLGLGAAALACAMKKSAAAGARYCFGGFNPFYFKIGFQVLAEVEFWKKSD